MHLGILSEQQRCSSSLTPLYQVLCHAMCTWLDDSRAAVAWVCCQVVLHTAEALLAAEAQASSSKGVHNEGELAQEELQEP